MIIIDNAFSESIFKKYKKKFLDLDLIGITAAESMKMTVLMKIVF